MQLMNRLIELINRIIQTNTNERAAVAAGKEAAAAALLLEMLWKSWASSCRMKWLRHQQKDWALMGRVIGASILAEPLLGSYREYGKMDSGSGAPFFTMIKKLYKCLKLHTYILIHISLVDKSSFQEIGKSLAFHGFQG